MRVAAANGLWVSRRGVRLLLRGCWSAHYARMFLVRRLEVWRRSFAENAVASCGIVQVLAGGVRIVGSGIVQVLAGGVRIVGSGIVQVLAGGVRIVGS